MRLLACLIVAPQRGYDEPAILSYAISSFCPTSADGLHRHHPPANFHSRLAKYELRRMVSPKRATIGCLGHSAWLTPTRMSQRKPWLGARRKRRATAAQDSA